MAIPPQIHVSFFQGLKKVPPLLRAFSLQEACDFFTPTFPPIVEKDKRMTEGQPFSFNIYKQGKTRGKDHVDSMTGIVLDFDNKDGDFVEIESVTDKLYAKRLIYFWYTTYSHTATLPRWRLIIPFSQPLPVAQWKPVYQKMVILLDSPPGIDPACESIAQMWYPPFRAKGHSFQAHARREGFLLNPLHIDEMLSSVQQAEYAASHLPKQQSLSVLKEAHEIDAREIRECLQYIGADHYDDWIKVGMTLHHHFGGNMQGFSLWNDWSFRSSKYKGENDLLSHWQTFGRQGNPRTISTLIYLAQENGYRRPSALESRSYTTPSSPSPNSHDKPHLLREEAVAESLLSEEDKEERDYDFRDFSSVSPQDMPTPFLEGIFRYLCRCPFYENPVYALAATLVTGGFLMRKTIAKEERLNTNFMALSIGMTGTGKTQIFQGVKAILEALTQDKHVASKLISQQGFIEALRAREGCLFLLNDEASYAMEAMKSKSISHHELATEEIKMNLFSYPAFYTPPCSKGADLTPIPRPFFCELATSTSNILSSFSPRDFTSGLLPRYFLFHEQHKELIESKNPTLSLPEGLIEFIDQQCSLSVGERGMRVFEEEAAERLAQFKKSVFEARNHLLAKPMLKETILKGTVLARLFEHVRKLTFLASEKEGSRYVVRKAAVEWAIGIGLMSYKNMKEIIETSLHENRTEQMRFRVLEVIRKSSKGKWIPKGVTLRNITFLTRRELDDILLKLEDEGMIHIQKRGEKQFIIRSTTRKERNHQ